MFLKTALAILLVCICFFKLAFLSVPHPKINPNLQPSVSEDRDDGVGGSPTSKLFGGKTGSEAPGNAASGAKSQGRPTASQDPGLRWSAIDKNETSFVVTAEPHRGDTAQILAGGLTAVSPLQQVNLGAEVDILREQFDREKLKNKELLLSIVTVRGRANHLERLEADLEANLHEALESRDRDRTRLRDAEDESIIEKKENADLREQLKQASKENLDSATTHDGGDPVGRGPKCVVDDPMCGGIGVLSLLSLPFDATETPGPVSTPVADGGSVTDEAAWQSTASDPPSASKVAVPSEPPPACRDDAVVAPSPSGSVLTAVGNPSDLVTARIVLSYHKNDVSAQAKASAIDTLLTGHGFRVDILNATGHGSHKTGVTYFYAEDRSIADEIAGILATPQAMQKSSPGNHATQPGTIEVDVAGTL